MLEKTRVLLHNAYMTIRSWVKGPDCCGLWENPDGRLVECDDWWGYQNCMFPGCGHYQIEHSDGTPNKIIYAKDNPELVGTLVVDPVGCMNAGCEDCPKFWTKEDLHNFMHLLARARHHASHMMFYDGHGSERDENVRHVDTNVSVVVQVTTSVASHDHDALERVFEREGKLRDMFPDILFNFDVRFEPQDVKPSISE